MQPASFHGRGRYTTTVTTALEAAVRLCWVLYGASRRKTKGRKTIGWSWAQSCAPAGDRYIHWWLPAVERPAARPLDFDPVHKLNIYSSICLSGPLIVCLVICHSHIHDWVLVTDTNMSSTVSPSAFKMPSARALENAKQGSETILKDASETMSKAAENPKKATADFLHTPFMRAALPFINGGLAGMTATSVIQPVDMVKVRLQLAGEGAKTGPKPTPIGVLKDIVAAGKVTDLYTGLSAGLLRQAVYTTARLGFFDTFMKRLAVRAKENGTAVGFKERAGAGLAAGGLAAVVGNPADLALIRMQSDGMKPAAQRANYTSVVDALTRISRNEGVLRLWAGAYPTVVRAMALNFGQLAFFSEAKAQLKNTSLSSRTQTLTASAVAGFFASFLSLPFDFMKTRLQKQTRAPDGTLPYKGMFDCFRKVAKEEGLLRFYRGFGTYYVRIAPHA
jgi:solute carrier family 25 oxoglutarate transporter 11